ncbi:hypothetical protein [Clostridium intestinale]|uniref:hypothetical protein n=1 Tax=Clostridium intestinale TaxID=36845 RepID=UPI0028ED1836|nr:hypothetical protein [Clostridium intestinale]
MSFLEETDNIVKGMYNCGICNERYGWYAVLNDLEIRTIPDGFQEGEIVCDVDDGIYEDNGFNWRRVEVYTKCPHCRIKNKAVEKIKLNKFY